MDITSEIARLQTAKADIKTAIENKGVTVPSNAKLDTYNTYIDAIQTSSGGESNSGEITFYSCSSTNPNAKGSRGRPPVPEPGVHETFYSSYDPNDQKIPDFLIIYDTHNTFGKGLYFVLMSGTAVQDSSNIGYQMQVTSITSTLATLQFDYSGGYSFEFDPSVFEVAPIYINT